MWQVLDPTPAVLRELKRDFRAIFTVRDPRDIVTAGYFYHKLTEEAWAHEPRAEYRGLSLHEMLLKVPMEEGIDLETDRLGADFHDNGYAAGMSIL